MIGRILASAGLGAALVSGLVLGGGSTGEATVPAHVRWAGYSWGNNLDSSSSAQPSAADPQVTDSVQNTVRTRSGTDKAIASATSSANCDGCKGNATTIQVVYFDGRRQSAAADNIATAWADSCAGCSASAVSLQVVVSPNRGDVKANNRALAVNAGCAGCDTSAAAIQFVLAGGKRRDLSAAAKQLVAQVKAELATQLNTAARQPSAGKARMQAESTTRSFADRIQDIVVKDLGGGSVDRSIDVKVGS